MSPNKGSFFLHFKGENKIMNDFLITHSFLIIAVSIFSIAYLCIQINYLYLTIKSKKESVIRYNISDKIAIVVIKATEKDSPWHAIVYISQLISVGWSCIESTIRSVYCKRDLKQVIDEVTVEANGYAELLDRDLTKKY